MALDLRATRQGNTVRLNTSPRTGVLSILSTATKNPLQPPTPADEGPSGFGAFGGEQPESPGVPMTVNTPSRGGSGYGASQLGPGGIGPESGWQIDRASGLFYDPVSGVYFRQKSAAYTSRDNQYVPAEYEPVAAPKPAASSAITPYQQSQIDMDNAARDYKIKQDQLDRDYRDRRDKINDDRYITETERQKQLDALNEWRTGQEIALQRASQLGFDENGHPTLATMQALGRITNPDGSVNNTLARDLGEAESRRADLNTNLGRQNQAFNQEMARRNEAVQLGLNPVNYLEYAALHSGRPVDPNTTLGAALGRITPTPDVETFLENQRRGSLGPTTAAGQGSAAAAPAPPAAPAPATDATPGAQPAGVASVLQPPDLGSVLQAPTAGGANPLSDALRAVDASNPTGGQSQIRMATPSGHGTGGQSDFGPINLQGYPKTTRASLGLDETLPAQTGPTIGNAPRQSGALTMGEARDLTGGTLPGGLETAYNGRPKIGSYSYRPIGGVRKLAQQTQNALSTTDRQAQVGLLQSTGNALNGDSDLLRERPSNPLVAPSNRKVGVA